MAKEDPIIRVEQEGVEFFTIKKTGKSGMSVSGLSVVCGEPRSSVSKLIVDLATKSPSKWLNHLVGLDLNLATGEKRGGKVRILKSEVCSAVTRHYAFSGSERAQDFLAGLEDAAMDIFIQRITGWQPPSDVEKFIDAHILRQPRSWEIVFDRQWIKAAEQATGWSWGDPCMSRLINMLVYDRLPVEVRTELDNLNPVQSCGHRAKKQHQFFSVDSVEQVLKLQISVSRSLLLVSTSRDELKENSRRHFEGMSQLKLLS